MALKAVITAQEHGALQEGWKALYKQEGDAFILDAEGIDAHPATLSLKRALESERGISGAAARELKDLKDKLGDMSPDDARAALQRIQEIEEKSRLGEIPEKFKKQFDDAVAARIESIQKNHTNAIKGYEKQVADLNTQLQQSTGQLETLTIDGEVRTVAARKGLQDWAVEDAIMHARQLYRLKDGKPIPMRGDQIVFSGKKPGDPKPIDEWLDEKVTEKPGWLKPNGGGGSDHHRTNGGASGQFTLTREQARDRKTYVAMQEQARKAGQEVTISE